jgi:hypothetical protein
LLGIAAACAIVAISDTARNVIKVFANFVFIAVTEKTIRLEGKDNSDNILSTAISSLMLELIRLINPSRESRVVLIEHFLNPLQLAEDTLNVATRRTGPHCKILHQLGHKLLVRRPTLGSHVRANLSLSALFGPCVPQSAPLASEFTAFGRHRF